MIDWLTLNLGIEHMSANMIAALQKRQSMILKIDPDGNVEWTSPARESIRSDSHQLTVVFGTTRLQLTGSPARIDGENNVFGTSDIHISALKMIHWAGRFMELPLPDDLDLWTCSRIDFNQNYFLGDAATVRQALLNVRNVDAGRYRLQGNSETVYWGSPQARISGKVYHKGSHLNYQINSRQALAPPEHVQLAQGLIRLEIKIGNRFLNDPETRRWTDFTPEYLRDLFDSYFRPLIGGAEVVDMEKDLIEQLEKFAPTKGQARSAYGHWLQIKQVGFEHWKSLVGRTTFYRVKKILLDAGFSYSDFQAQNIVPIRRKPILLDQPVRSWEELRKVVNQR
jgi:II/X family phage/plasmid replication protein